MTYNESSRNRQARLETEGRWEQFENRRKELRIKYRAERREKPGSVAFQQACEEFALPGTEKLAPPEDETADENETVAKDKTANDCQTTDDQLVPLSEFGDNTTHDASAIRWVADNLAVANVKPVDAPTPGNPRPRWALRA